MSEHLFVYGTLKRSFSHPMHAVLVQHGEFAGLATLCGLMYRVAHYPGVVASDDSAHIVHGELYVIRQPQALFDILDDYEECSSAHPQPHEYVRKLCTVSLPDGRELQSWVYVYELEVADLEFIVSGYFD